MDDNLNLLLVEEREMFCRMEQTRGTSDAERWRLVCNEWNNAYGELVYALSQWRQHGRV